MAMDRRKIQYADDDVTPVKRLLRMRFPSLVIGLVLGVSLSFLTSRFEEVLAADVRIAFFLPFIVYMAAAVGSQTGTIYTRDLKEGKASFKTYLFKETILGIIIGVGTSIVTFGLIRFVFDSVDLALAVSLGMLAAIISAPLIALAVTELLEIEHTDPAVGEGPIATVIQDTFSILIYGLIATAIIL